MKLDKDTIIGLLLSLAVILLMFELVTGVISTLTGKIIIRIAEVMITFGRHLIRI